MREHREVMNSLESLLGAGAEQAARTPAAGLSSADCAYPPAVAAAPWPGPDTGFLFSFLLSTLCKSGPHCHALSPH